MTVYPRRRARLVPKTPDPGPRHTRPAKRKRPAMQMIVARMKCGRTEYEARLPMPTGASKDPRAIHRLKLQLRLMLAEQVVKGSSVRYTSERLSGGVLR